MTCGAVLAEFDREEATATLQAARRLTNPIAGVVGSVIRIPLPYGEPDIACAAAVGSDAAWITRVRRGGPTSQSSGGAGMVWEQAAARAIGEVLERYAASRPDPEELRVARWADVGGPNPAAYSLFSEAQRAQGIPYARFDEHTNLEWVPATDMCTGVPAWAPAKMVYLASGARPWLVDIGPSTSTGAACARSRLDATLAGLLEVVERDAFAITWWRRLQTAPVALPHTGPMGRLFRERFACCGLEFVIRLLPTDLEIPVVLVIVLDRAADRAVAAVGAAAHRDPARALLKALLEAAQTRIWLLQMGGGAGFDPGPGYAHVRRFRDHVLLYGRRASLPALSFLLDTSRPAVYLEDLPVHHRSTEADLAFCVDRLQRSGLRPLVVDLTTPELAASGFCVVKVMVPGLVNLAASHAYPFLGSRRLWEVPARLGLAVCETLNPYPHPFP